MTLADSPDIMGLHKSKPPTEKEMFKVTIEATTKQDKALLPYLRDHLCYGLEDDSALEVNCKEWKEKGSHSGGDDAYFGLQNKKVKVIIL